MTLDQEAMRNFFQQVLDLWVRPEIARRQRDGILPNDYNIDKIQILFGINGNDKAVIRLNKEIRALYTCRLKPGIHKQITGEPVYWKEIEDILDMQLTEEDDPDAAHITMILSGKGWKIKFDFRRYKRKAKERYDAAREFLDAARNALNEGHLRAFADTLFSSAELFITSQLFVMSEKEYVLKPTHTWTQIKYNSFIEMGNYKNKYRDAFNKLAGLRDGARYFNRSFNLTVQQAEQFLHVVEDLEKHTNKVII